MPSNIVAYVLRFTGKHQIGLAILSIAVFALSAVPLELQRRIVNTIVGHGAFATVVWLALGYAGVALIEQCLNSASTSIAAGSRRVPFAGCAPRWAIIASSRNRSPTPASRSR